jgi:energy-coupling factor transport system permease protein
MIRISDITLGQFAPRESSIHHLDPRTKLLSIGVFMFILMFSQKLEILLSVFVIGLLLMFLAKLQLKLAFKNIRPFLWLFLLTFFLHALLTKGKIIVMIPFTQLIITEEGIYQGIFYTFRIMTLIVLASLLTLTTSPMSLTDALERILRPFRKIGFPAHEIAMMLSIAMRFIPILIDEVQRIRNAQLSRGASFQGHLIKKIRGIVPMIVPLFLSAFRRANDLALAMDARCYHGGEGRTSLQVLRFKRNDALALGILCLGITPVILWFN